jgi:hypothetical protein
MVEANGHANGTVPPYSEQQLRRMEELVANIWSCRSDFFKQFWGQHKDIDNECGWWPDPIAAEGYRQLYDRNAIAERVVELYPKECWQLLEYPAGTSTWSNWPPVPQHACRSLTARGRARRIEGL